MLIRGRLYWWRRLQRELFQVNKISKGSINLSFGRHEIFIPLACPDCVKINRIYLCCDGVGDPVCQGDIDMCNYTLLNEGFVIYADVRHNISNIYWMIEYNVLDIED